MTLFIIIGVLVPMVYTMQLNIKNEPVTKRNLLITLALSTVGILVTALACDRYETSFSFIKCSNRLNFYWNRLGPFTKW